MKFSSLKRLHVIIIGVVICLIAGAGMFYLVIKPANEKYAQVEAAYIAAAQTGTAENVQRSLIELQQTQVNAIRTNNEFKIQMNKRMPNLSFARRDIGMTALWDEQIFTLGPLIESFARGDKNVTVTPYNVTVSAPPVDPNSPVFDLDVLEFKFPALSVRGNFSNLMKNVTRWNNCSRLVMVDPVSLSGNSPDLTASYSITCYIFPKEKGGDRITMAGGAAAPAR